mmetsp:Transcript_22391/g.53256  ORF Transcript_22391/g.53256 Transcript_22391/m.53256 type:complete len:111 (-) Transcript_22391:230-562(-)
MGIFKKSVRIEDDGATIEVQPAPKEDQSLSLAQLKKARRKERKVRSSLFAAKKERRSQRISELVRHSNFNRSGGPQNEYCASPKIVEDQKQVASVGWKTAKIAVRGFFRK